MGKEYIITAPTLSKSNGVKLLYLMYVNLLRRGQKARMFSPKVHLPGFNYISSEEIDTDEIRENAIIIYPEIVVGNPFNIRNVVRYVLYYPGVIGGAAEYHHSEFIITHESQFYPGAFKLTIPWIDKNMFYDDNSPKTQNCYFVYKKGKFRDVPEIEGAVEININYPKTKPELVQLLRTTDTLYSYDDSSSLLTEASLCGAKVKIIKEDCILDYKDYYEDLISDFETEMTKFIELTQQLNYKGPTESEEAAMVAEATAMFNNEEANATL